KLSLEDNVKFGRKGKRKVYSQPVRNVKRCIVISGKVKKPGFSEKEVSISPERSKHFRKMLTSF
ncbi:hypothetical protein O1400_03625, partial [Bacteroides fragilis]|uniref:hypothetical protein n=1 Tax=Bacteroides fragilis TaxID=817 RepID=UPI0022AB003D